MPRLSSRGLDPTRFVEITMWIGAVISCLGLTALLRTGGRGLEPLPEMFSGVPFTAARRPHFSPVSLLAPAVAAVVVVGAWRGVHSRMRWGRLLLAGYVASLGWTVALAAAGRTGLSGPLSGPDGYLAELGTVDHDPLGFLRTFTGHASAYGSDTRSHPPGPALLLWTLTRLGITAPGTLGLVLTALGAAALPLAAIAVRSLCHETAARRLVPVLALAPWAVWMVASVDGVAAMLAAAFVTFGVIGSEPGRRLGWSAASGLLLGMATLFNYGVPWLGIAVVATYFVRRRPLLNMITGACFLVPLSLAAFCGYSWPDGFAVAGTRAAGSTTAGRGWMTLVPVGLAVVLVACGPLVVRAARRVRLTPGWPLLLGAVAAIGFGMLTGLAPGEAARAWLPFYCWLLVPALAPDPRPDGPGDTARAGTLPLGLTGVGALTAIVARACLPGSP